MTNFDFEPRVLRYLVAAAETRSFSAASRLMHVAQPWLSTRLRQLEADLGFALFERTPLGLVPTEKGNAFLGMARRMLDLNAQMNGLARVLSGRETQVLGVGAALFTSLIARRIEITESFTSAHPEVELEIDNRMQSRLVRRLRSGAIDLTFAFGLPISSARWDEYAIQNDEGVELLIPDDCEWLSVGSTNACLLLPAENPLSQRDRLTLDDLAGLGIVMFSPMHGALYDQIAAPLRHAGARIVHAPEGNCMAAERFGCQARLPTISLGWFAPPDAPPIVRQELRDLSARTELRLLRRPGPLRPAADLFWSFTRGRCRA